MIDLKDYKERIEQFIIAGLEKFIRENGEPSSMGIYCCPWSGWISLNFNKSKTLDETQQNCPDFEFVEFDLIDFESWSEEYESDNPQWSDTLFNNVYFDNGSGDEDLNHFFYRFLRDLLFHLNQKLLPTTVLQMLDSRYCEKVIFIK